jgi:hypothetical protein
VSTEYRDICVRRKKVGGAGATLAGRAGAAAHGLLPLTGVVEVLAPTQRAQPKGVRIRQATLRTGDITTRHRMPVLTIPRLILDCARHPWLDTLIHEAEVAGRLDLEAIEDVLERHRGHRGVRLLKAALDDRDRGTGRTRNELEHEAARFLARHGFPPQERNVLFELPSGEIIERDCFFRHASVVLELDGRGVHATARAFEEDRRKDAALLRSRSGTPAPSG